MTHSAKRTIGLIGVGDIIHCHLTALQANPEYQLMGICRLEADRLKAQAAQLGVNGYLDYRDLLARKPDVVLISLPHHLHDQVALDAMDAGCHILMEKPMAISMDQIQGMIHAAKNLGCAMMVTESSYWQPAFQTARQIVQAGELGKLLFGQYTNHRNYFTKTRPDWFLASKTSGGGQFINVGVHRMSAIRCILGDHYEEMSVTASVHRIDPKYDIEAATQAMVMYTDGQSMSYEECGYFLPPKALSCGLHFVFEHGVMGIGSDHIWTSDRQGNTTQHDLLPPPPGGAYGALYKQMLLAMQGQTHYPTMEHGAKDVRIALAAYASAQQKQTIDLRKSPWQIQPA